jgi:integrase
MARQIGKLAPVTLGKALKPGMHADGGGLYLQVTAPSKAELQRDPDAKGARSWSFRFMLNGQAREMGLGPLHTFSLAEARERARECRKLLADGIDPIEHRKAKRAGERLAAATAMTFKQCAEAYIAGHKAGWKNRVHAAQWPATLSAYVYPIFGDLPVQAVDVGLVTKALEPIWHSKSETASRVRGRIESVLDWAKARDYRQGDNPARWRGHLDKLLPPRAKVRKVTHHPALPYDDMAEFIAALRQQEGIAARALEFLILTAARTGEVIGARWSEFDLAEKLWTVPADRMKASKEHRVPLSPAAVAIIEAMKSARVDNHDFIFPGGKRGKPLSNMAMLKLLTRMGRGDLTAHGFRSTFRDWAAERTSYPREVAEMALAHAVGDKVEAAYRRGDLFTKRRRLMDEWAKHCSASSKSAATVVRMIQGVH